MKRFTPLLLVVITGHAQAGPESLVNPLTFMNPMAASNPLAGYGSPLGGIGGGYGGGYGGANALSVLSALGMLAAPAIAPLAPSLLNPMGMGQFSYPAMQMAPNLMSYGHYSQYGGGLFGGNPYMQRSLPSPLAPPAFTPSVPTLPFSPTQGTLPLPFGTPYPGTPSSPFGAPSLPFGAPSLPFGAPSLPFGAPAQTSVLPGLPFLGGAAMSPAPGFFPGMAPTAPAAPQMAANPWARIAPPQPAAAAPASAQPPAWPMMFPPFMSPPSQAQAPAAAPQAPQNLPQAQPSAAPMMFLPFMSPPAQAPAPAAAPQAPTGAPQTPAAVPPAQAAVPFMWNPWMMLVPAPQATAVAPPAPPQAEAVPAAPAAPAPEARPLPMDPASFMEMFMRPGVAQPAPPAQ